MWILRYLILATRQRCNTLLDRRTRMTFDPLHGCPMHVCRDKTEWDQRGKDQVAQLESELRQDIEAYHTETKERRVIAGETIEVRPVVLEKAAEPVQAFKEFLGVVGSDQSPSFAEATEGAPSTEGGGLNQNTLLRSPEGNREQRTEETILPEAEPEMEAAPAPTGDALVSSGVEAQAEAEPGADPTLLPDEGLNGLPQNDAKPEPEKMDGTGTGTEDGTTDFTGSTDGNPEPAQAGTTIPGPGDQSPSFAKATEGAPSTEVKPKAKTKPAGKAGRK